MRLEWGSFFTSISANAKFLSKLRRGDSALTSGTFDGQ
jgi:hypothetical protein